MNLQKELHDGEMCLVDSAITHTIVCNNKYFMSLIFFEVKVNTIASPVDQTEGSIESYSS